MNENKNRDKKSLRLLKGRQTDWNELAKDCVCFANAKGGYIYIGIEDNESFTSYCFSQVAEYIYILIHLYPESEFYLMLTNISNMLYCSIVLFVVSGAL